MFRIDYNSSSNGNSYCKNLLHDPDFYCQHVLALKMTLKLLWLLNLGLTHFVKRND